MTRAFQDALRSIARQQPGRPAFSFHGDDGVQRVAYGQLVADIDRALAAAQRPQAGERVFIAAATEYPAIVAYLAALAGGAVPAFLSPLTPRQDPVIHARELQALLDRFQPQWLMHGGVLRRLHARPPGPHDPVGGFLQFSSGTTSLRKAVFIPEQRLVAQLAALGGALQVVADDRIASWLPLYHDMGLVATLFLPLVHGASVAFLDAVAWSYRPDSLLRLVAQERSTLCWQPDFAFRHLCNHQRRSGAAASHDLRSLRALISCSEPCRAASFDEFRALFAPAGLHPDALQTCYAMAETVFAVTQSRFAAGALPPAVDGFLSSGAVIDGCSLRIAAPDTQGVGEIQLRSDFLFDRYEGQPSPARPEGWHATGDLGCLRDGQLHVLGRIDDTLVVHGKKIIAHQVEDHLGTLPGFKPGRVFCTLAEGGNALVVYHEGETLAADCQRQVRQWVASSSAVTLDRLVAVPAGTLVKSSSGKIARAKSLHKLRAQASAVPTALAA